MARMLGPGLVIAAAAALAACGGTDVGRPNSAPAPDPAGLERIWSAEGSTGDGNLHDATYFNDRPAAVLPAGGVAIGWTCTGGTNLMVGISFVAGRGPAAVPSPEEGLSEQLTCPTGGMSWIRLAARAAGGENVLVIRPTTEPAPPIQYQVVVAHLVE